MALADEADGQRRNLLLYTATETARCKLQAGFGCSKGFSGKRTRIKKISKLGRSGWENSVGVVLGVLLQWVRHFFFHTLGQPFFELIL